MNSSKNLVARLSVLLAFLIPVAVQAHPGHPASGMEQGLLHPVTGLDHLLAMLAVGLWAGRLGGAMRWAAPAMFVSVMALAGMVGVGGAAFPGLEHGVAASVVILGLAIALAVRPSALATMGMVAAFAVFHGYAHGAEMAAGASVAAYGAGFAITTALLHAAGLALAAVLARSEGSRVWLRVAGGAIAVAGLALGVA